MSALVLSRAILTFSMDWLQAVGDKLLDVYMPMPIVDVWFKKVKEGKGSAMYDARLYNVMHALEGMPRQGGIVGADMLRINRAKLNLKSATELWYALVCYDVRWQVSFFLSKADSLQVIPAASCDAGRVLAEKDLEDYCKRVKMLTTEMGKGLIWGQVPDPAGRDRLGQGRRELKAGDGYSKTAAEGFIDAYEGRSLDAGSTIPAPPALDK
eukprot:Skav213968  [mRNA]  locus=scaffold2200:163767:167427:+ [translate_table: standard]